MKDKLVNVKTYHFSANEVKIAFSMANPAEPELIYEDKQGERRFSGRSIYQEETEFGFMSTVVLEEAPDSHRITLSLALPSANKAGNIRSIPVKTFAVQTTNRTSIAGPAAVEGQIQTYEMYLLEGNAW